MHTVFQHLEVFGFLMAFGAGATFGVVVMLVIGLFRYADPNDDDETAL